MIAVGAWVEIRFIVVFHRAILRSKRIAGILQNFGVKSIVVTHFTLIFIELFRSGELVELLFIIILRYQLWIVTKLQCA